MHPRRYATAITLAMMFASAVAHAERPDRERAVRSRPPQPSSPQASRPSSPLAPAPEPVAPDQLDDTGGAPPPRYHRVERVRQGLAITGFATFATAYAPMALLGISAAGCSTEGHYSDSCMFSEAVAGTLPIPVFGPFMAIEPVCGGGDNPLCSAFLVANGVTQAAGIAMLLYGLQSRPVFERYAAAPRVPRYAVAASPLPQGGVVSLSGAF